MSKKEDVIQDIVQQARYHNISLEEIASALNAPLAQSDRPSASMLSKMFGYLGGIFVFAGIGVFISMYWDDFGSAARVTVTLGTGFLVFVTGLFCLQRTQYEKTATPLFLMASLLQPVGIIVMLDEYGSGGDMRYGLIYMSLYMLIQQGAAFWAKDRTVLAFSAILFGCIFFANLFDLWGIDEELIGIVVGCSLLCIAYAINQSKHIAISSFWYFVGALILLWSVFDTIEGTLFEPLFLGLSAAIIFLSTYVRSRTLLFVGTISILIYIGYYTAEHFADMLGWPIALVIIGVALIAVSSLAVKLNNMYIKSVG